MRIRTFALKLVSLKSISSGGSSHYITYERARSKNISAHVTISYRLARLYVAEGTLS